jgi:hypothetical protein
MPLTEKRDPNFKDYCSELWGRYSLYFDTISSLNKWKKMTVCLQVDLWA